MKKILFLIILVAISTFATEGRGTIKEISVLNDYEVSTGKNYKYAIVDINLTSPGTPSRFILNLPNAEFMSTLLSAQASGKSVYIKSLGTWGLSNSTILGGIVNEPIIHRLSIYTINP